MLYVFYGSEVVAVRKKAFDFVALQEADGFKLERIEAENYSIGMCADIVGSVSLFGDKTLYVLDTPSQEPLFKEEVEMLLEKCKESQNLFVVIEGKMLAPEKKKYAKFAESVEEVLAVETEKYNSFEISDALALKDKKTLWLCLQNARHAGMNTEMIIGILWWQLKTLRLVKNAPSAVAIGMKQYPYDKAKRSISNFKEGELEKLSQSLLHVYHQGHQSGGDTALALEKWTLTI